MNGYEPDISTASQDVNANVISHPGIVERVGQETVFVKILAASACVSCQVKKVCNLADSAEKVIEVKNPADRVLHEGDRVDVTMKRSLGGKAVLLGYLLPFVIVLVALVVMLAVTDNEGLSGLVALAMAVPYYIVLYLMRDKLRKTFTFSIR